MIYLNSASHGLPAQATRDRIAAHTALEAEIGAMAAHELAMEELENVHKKAAHLIGASPAQTGLGTTTTAVWLPLLFRLPPGAHILAAPHEWGDNIRALKALTKATGQTLEILPPLEGDDPSLWEKYIKDETAALFYPFVSSVHGIKYPVESIAKLPRPDGMALILDAAQALGQIPVDVQALGCDALVATCRKWLCGPRNTALFWLGEKLGGERAVAELTPNDANVAVRLGLGAAIAEAGDIAARQARISHLSTMAAEALEGLPLHARQTGAVALTLEKGAADRTEQALQAADTIAKFPKPEWDEPAASLPPQGTRTLRITPNVYNTEGDITALAETIRTAL